MKLLRLLALISRPKEPTWEPGTGSPTVPSPVTSERKISPGSPDCGRNKVIGMAVDQWDVRAKRVVHGRSTTAPALTKCVRSRPDGPTYLHASSKSTALLS